MHEPIQWSYISVVLHWKGCRLTIYTPASISPPANSLLSWLAVSQASSCLLLCEVIDMQRQARWRAHTDTVTDTWTMQILIEAWIEYKVTSKERSVKNSKQLRCSIILMSPTALENTLQTLLPCTRRSLTASHSSAHHPQIPIQGKKRTNTLRKTRGAVLQSEFNLLWLSLGYRASRTLIWVSLDYWYPGAGYQLASLFQTFSNPTMRAIPWYSSSFPHNRIEK